MFISNEDTYSNDIFIEIIKFIKRYNKFNVDTDIYINKLDLLPDIYKNKDEYRTLYNIITTIHNLKINTDSHIKNCYVLVVSLLTDIKDVTKEIITKFKKDLDNQIEIIMNNFIEIVKYLGESIDINLQILLDIHLPNNRLYNLINSILNYFKVNYSNDNKAYYIYYEIYTCASIKYYRYR